MKACIPLAHTRILKRRNQKLVLLFFMIVRSPCSPLNDSRPKWKSADDQHQPTVLV
jgi:hypothetical protein